MSNPIMTLIEAARAAVAYHCSSYLGWHTDDIEKDLREKVYRRPILELERARRAAVAFIESPEPVCHHRDDSDGIWSTECGHTLTWTEGTPEENGAEFCWFCGARLVAVPWVEPEEEDTP